MRFVEDNWLRGQRLGGGSFDDGVESIMDMFDFDHGDDRQNKLFLDPTAGTVIVSPSDDHHNH